MIATTFILPVDAVKVRLQLIGEAQGKPKPNPLSVQKPNPLLVIKQIFKTNGIKGFYKGISAAYCRQATYGTAKFGLYKSMFLTIQKKNGKVKTYEKAGCSLLAGFVGSMIGNPSDLALIRFQSDEYLPKNRRRNYKNVFEAFYRIIREEGVLRLWRGCGSTVVRGMTMNLAMLTTFDEVKEFLNDRSSPEEQNSIKTRLISSAVSGVVCSFVSLPFDNIKTKMQKMVIQPNGKYPYKSVIDCFFLSIRREGFTGLWVGLPTYYCRVAPQSMITLLCMEFLHNHFNKENMMIMTPNTMTRKR